MQHFAKQIPEGHQRHQRPATQVPRKLTLRFSRRFTIKTTCPSCHSLESIYSSQIFQCSRTTLYCASCMHSTYKYKVVHDIWCRPLKGRGYKLWVRQWQLGCRIMRGHAGPRCAEDGMVNSKLKQAMTLAQLKLTINTASSLAAPHQIMKMQWARREQTRSSRGETKEEETERRRM